MYLFKSIRNSLTLSIAMALVGCASPSGSMQSFEDKSVGSYVVLGAGVTDIGILVGPPSRFGAAYSLVDNLSRPRQRVFFFDTGYDGTLDVVCSSDISKKGDETAVGYWKGDEGLRKYEKLFRELDSRYGDALREKYR